jgi:vitamin B12 transporter
MQRLWVLLLPILVASTVWADEVMKIKEVVVTATKIEEAVDETTSSVRIVKNETIEEMNVELVVEVLKNVPELNLVQNGGAGKSATVVLRGGSASQTMVMIDGVKVKSTTLGEFDFSGITAHDIDRIEIVKGPQSTIYGSEAMAGVINIITKKGRGEPAVKLSLEGGSYATINPSLTVSGGSEKANYRLSGSYFITNGFSSAKLGTENDGYENASMSGKIGLKASERLELEFGGRYYYDSSELDAFGRDDLNYVRKGHHYLLSGKAKLYLLDNYEQVFSLSRVEDSLKFRDPDTSYFNSDIISAIDTVDWQHNFYLTDSYVLTFGAEYRIEAGENIDKSTESLIFDKKVDNSALYANSKIKLFDDALVFNAGVRYDDHETFGDEITYRVGGIYNIRPALMKVKGSYGTGFRAPTLNELFFVGAFSSGNINLRPETSKGWELGIEKEIVKERASVSITYFDQKYSDLIVWLESPPGSWMYSPLNVSKAEVKGLEAGAEIQVTDAVSFSSTYSYTDTKDKDTEERLKRRPIDKLNVSVDYTKGPASLLISYTYIGKAYESTSVGNLSSYSLLNMSGGYSLSNRVRIFGRIENMLDENYETAAGYESPDLSAYGGIELAI